jgi:predicted phosphodiesterase
MLTAILTDVHANLEALSACLGRARRQGADKFAFLGDFVGYGADPAPMVDIIRRFVDRGVISVRGNHDEAVAQNLRPMNADAQNAIEWTRGRVNPEQLAFLAALPLTAEEDGLLYVHANAWDPGRWEYVHGRYDAGPNARSRAIILDENGFESC